MRLQLVDNQSNLVTTIIQEQTRTQVGKQTNLGWNGTRQVIVCTKTN